MTKNKKGIALLPTFIIFVLLGILGYLAFQYYQSIEEIEEGNFLSRISNSLVPSIENLNLNLVLPTFNSSKSKIKLMPTDDWTQVVNNHIYFKIPPEAKCNNNLHCTQVTYSEMFRDQETIHTINIFVDFETGAPLKEQYLSPNNTTLNCKPIYEESLFGSIKALQIAIHGGWCNPERGAIVSIIGNKIVTFKDLTYNPRNNRIHRWEIRDTIISTLSPTQ